jgi:hypothetical protein
MTRLCWSSTRRAAILAAAGADLVLFVVSQLPLWTFSLLLPYLFKMTSAKDGDTYSGKWHDAAVSRCFASVGFRRAPSPMSSSGPRRGSAPLLRLSFVAGIARLLANVDACKRRGRVQRSTARCGRQRLDRLGFRPVPQWRLRAGKVAAALVVW